MAPSPALSILENGPTTLAGRKLGVLITEGANSDLVEELRQAANVANVVIEVVAPTVAGVVGSNGAVIPAEQKIDGGPSVLYDAVVVLTAPDAVAALAGHPAARDFVTDAYAHAKFIGYSGESKPLFNAVGLPEDLDEGFVDLNEDGVENFLDVCARFASGTVPFPRHDVPTPAAELRPQFAEWRFPSGGPNKSAPLQTATEVTVDDFFLLRFSADDEALDFTVPVWQLRI